MLLTNLKTREARLAHGCFRNALVLHIENQTLERQGKALTNFEAQLPKAQSDLARESLKDPHHFDFLTLAAEATERELEAALVQQMTRFLNRA